MLVYWRWQDLAKILASMSICIIFLLKSVAAYLVYLFDGRQHGSEGYIQVVNFSNPPKAHADVENCSPQQHCILLHRPDK